MRHLLLALGLALWTAPAFAQSAADCSGAPTTPIATVDSTPVLEFAKSSEHDTMIAGSTTPILTNYAVAVCTGTTLTTQGTLGKPTPNGTTGKIVVALPNASLLAKNIQYYVIVYAVGPGGSAKGTPIAPFAVAGPPAAVLDGSVRSNP